MKKYTTIKVQGYEMETPEGNLMKVTTYILIEKDPKIALERAKKLGKHSFYRVSEVFEFYDK